MTSEKLSSPLQRYGLAILSVAVVLGINILLAAVGVAGAEFPLFLVAVALTAWYAGKWPGIVCVILAALTFNYFFTEPRYSLLVAPGEIPFYVAFVLFAILITWFSSVRRRVESDLLQSRDELRKEVATRAQQASLLDLTHDPIFVRNMDGIILYWNRGAQESYGWTAEEAVGKSRRGLLQTVFPKPLGDIMKDLVETGRWEGELERTKSDGTQVLVASRWSLQRDESGNPVAVLICENNITERKQREEYIRGLNQELSKRSTELEATNKELEAFAYSVSHDLRAPLRHIAGFAELLQKNASTQFDDKGRRHMAAILDSAKRMGMLIDDLLTFSRIGRSEARETLVSLEQLVKEVQSDMLQEADGRNINWKIAPLPSVRGDRSMLRVVFVNLVSNAVKFTRTRSTPEIEIGCAHKQAAKVLFVKDNGVGFDMKYVNKLFGVFQRLHRADEFEGTGIGLATVQRIIHRHGGQVWAEGQLGSGATFYVSLPER